VRSGSDITVDVLECYSSLWHFTTIIIVSWINNGVGISARHSTNFRGRGRNIITNVGTNLLFARRRTIRRSRLLLRIITTYCFPVNRRACTVGRFRFFSYFRNFNTAIFSTFYSDKTTRLPRKRFPLQIR